MENHEEVTASQSLLDAAGISIAIKGRQWRPIERGDTLVSWRTGWQVWTPGDMATYLEADERERGIMRGVKGVPGGV